MPKSSSRSTKAFWPSTRLVHIVLQLPALFISLNTYRSFSNIKDMVEELTTGLSIALEVRSPNAPKSFREFCGPYDPVCWKMHAF